MKKITLLFAVLFALGTAFADQVVRVWNGSQLTDQTWNLSTANWLDPTFLFPLPKAFVEGATAVFNDAAVEGSDTIKVSGSIIMDSLKVNASRYYFLNNTVATDSLKGSGILEKKGTGTFELNVVNALKKGTVIYDGKLVMQKSASPNVIGDTLRLEGGTVNLGTLGSTSSSKVTFKSTIVVPANKSANLELARYSYLGSKVVGSGNINLFCAGERTFLGYESLPSGITQLQPDWSGFTGSVKVSKLVTSVTPGFWGLLLNTSKTYKDSLEFGFNVDSTWYNKKVTIGSGAVLGTHSGVKAYAIGELKAEDNTATLAGYRSASNGPRSYYFVGGLNTDVVFPGRISQAPGITSHYTHIAFIKVGTGTYTLTHPNNDIIGGLQVRQGRVLINSEVVKGQSYGGAGSFASVTKKGTFGGSGRVGGNVDIFGKLQPGVDGIGSLLLSDSISANYKSKYSLPISYSIKYTNASNTAATFSYKNGGNTQMNLNLHAGSVSEFEIASAASYDKVIATGKLKFGADTTSLGKPKIKIVAANGIVINDGDKFDIIKARSLDALSSGYDIEYPAINGVTWSVEEKYDTVAIEKETFSFTDKVTTKWTVDSIVNTNVTLDSIMVSYRVTVIAHGSTAVKNVTKTQLKMFPNPTVNVVYFESDDTEINTVEIVNIQGQVVQSTNVRSNKAQVNLESLPSGLYYARVHIGSAVEVKKIMLK